MTDTEILNRIYESNTDSIANIDKWEAEENNSETLREGLLAQRSLAQNENGFIDQMRKSSFVESYR